MIKDSDGQPIHVIRYRFLTDARHEASRLQGHVIQFESGEYGVVGPVQIERLLAAGYDLDAVFMG